MLRKWLKDLKNDVQDHNLKIDEKKNFKLISNTNNWNKFIISHNSSCITMAKMEQPESNCEDEPKRSNVSWNNFAIEYLKNKDQQVTT